MRRLVILITSPPITFNRKKGSNASKILKEKADELEDALNATMEKYSVEMMRD